LQGKQPIGRTGTGHPGALSREARSNEGAYASGDEGTVAQPHDDVDGADDGWE
jgi:hypothetical protein